MSLKNKNRSFPLYEAAVSAGFPSMAEDYTESALNLHDLLITHPAATFFVRVSGDSMLDAGISPGDILLVNRALEAIDRSIIIARVNGDLAVKRLHYEGKKIFLKSENGDHASLEITEATDFEIWGVVTCVIRRV